MENKDNIQLILVTESKNDYAYLFTVIRHIYDCKETKLSNVPMNGKHNYDDKSVKDKIEHRKEGFQGNSIVIYCYDTDDIFIKKEEELYGNKLEEYCSTNGYDLIWFCRTIEEVFIGEKIKDDKVKQMKKFLNNMIINDQIYIKSSIKSKGKTNLIEIIDKYCKRNNI